MLVAGGRGAATGQPGAGANLRDLSCLLLCSERLNARAQYAHLYFRSCTRGVFLGAGCAADAVEAWTVISAGIDGKVRAEAVEYSA